METKFLHNTSITYDLTTLVKIRVTANLKIVKVSGKFKGSGLS